MTRILRIDQVMRQISARAENPFAAYFLTSEGLAIQPSPEGPMDVSHVDVMRRLLEDTQFSVIFISLVTTDEETTMNALLTATAELQASKTGVELHNALAKNAAQVVVYYVKERSISQIPDGGRQLAERLADQEKEDVKQCPSCGSGILDNHCVYCNITY